MVAVCGCRLWLWMSVEVEVVGCGCRLRLSPSYFRILSLNLKKEPNATHKIDTSM